MIRIQTVTTRSAFRERSCGHLASTENVYELAKQREMKKRSGDGGRNERVANQRSGAALAGVTNTDRQTASAVTRRPAKMPPPAGRRLKHEARRLAAVAFLLETVNPAVSLNPTMVACGQLKLATTSLTDSHHELSTIQS
jgi:hypothetical protein